MALVGLLKGWVIRSFVVIVVKIQLLEHVHRTDPSKYAKATSASIKAKGIPSFNEVGDLAPVFFSAVPCPAKRPMR